MGCWNTITFLHEREMFVFCKRKKKDRTRSKKDRNGRGRESNLRKAVPSRDGSCAMEITQPIHQLKTINSRHRNERLSVISTASNKRHHSCPRHRCFENFISHQLGLTIPTLPKLLHLLTKRQRTPLAIIRCFLNFSSPHTPAFTPARGRSSWMVRVRE